VAIRWLQLNAITMNPVSLKVMRLCKPNFVFDLIQKPAQCDAGPRKALLGKVSLPHSFGDIYLGETFCCYVSLRNISETNLAHVGLKVEVQTQQQRETLSDSSSPSSAISRFSSQNTLEEVVRYELKDVGIHILICSALYIDGVRERKYFRKFFKFHVNNPISMKSRTHTLVPFNEVFVETQLQNAMQRELFVQSVRFRMGLQLEMLSLNAFPHYQAAPTSGAAASRGGSAHSPRTVTPPTPLGGVVDVVATRAATAAGSTSATFRVPEAAVSFAQLKAGDTQQHMYRRVDLVPDTELKQDLALGRMEVMWTSSIGEFGQLQSNIVQHNATSSRDIEVAVVSAPHEVETETPFELALSVANTSAAEMKLQLRSELADLPNSIVVEGTCVRALGSLRPHTIDTFRCTLVALEPGLQKVVALKLFDSLSEQLYELGVLVCMLVRE